MSGHLIVLEKWPGILPVGVGETWQRLFAKCVMSITVLEATNACQDDQLYASLKAVIDRALNGVQDIWDANSSMKYWIFLLVDENNTFNKMNRIILLWTVFHLCLYINRFLKLLLSLVIDCIVEW